MAWYDDILGRENVDAIKKAYNNSPAKRTVDAVSSGIDNTVAGAQELYNDANDKYDAVNRFIQNARQAGIEARLGNQKSLQDKIPQNYAEFVEQDKPLEDMSGIMLLGGLGGGASKVVTPKAAQVMKPLGAKHSDEVLAANKIARDRYASARLKHDQDITRQMMKYDDIKRGQAIEDVGLERRIKQYMADKGSGRGLNDFGYNRF